MLEERLAQTRSSECRDATARAAKSFLERWQAAIARWEQQAAPLKGVPIVVYHKDFSYFINWTGMREAGASSRSPAFPRRPRISPSCWIR